MKRIGNLYNKIYDLNNLYSAFYKASRHKKQKNAVILYQNNLQTNLVLLQKQLMTKNYEIGNYHYFTIHDPKLRNICAASFPERVLHHAIINITEDIFNKFQIFDSYACQIGKGTKKAILRCRDFAKKYKFAVKLDIRKYYDTINQSILLNKLKLKFKDNNLIDLFNGIIKTYCFENGKGIPIGNLTSQFFANFYLVFLDRFIKEKLKVNGYLRYMDDFVLFADSVDKLRFYVEQITIFLSNELKLILKPPVYCKSNSGIPFLGFKVFAYKIKLSSKSKLRFIRKVKSLDKDYLIGKISQKLYFDSNQSLFSWISLGNTITLRRNVIHQGLFLY